MFNSPISNYSGGPLRPPAHQQPGQLPTSSTGFAPPGGPYPAVTSANCQPYMPHPPVSNGSGDVHWTTCTNAGGSNYMSGQPVLSPASPASPPSPSPSPSSSLSVPSPVPSCVTGSPAPQDPSAPLSDCREQHQAQQSNLYPPLVPPHSHAMAMPPYPPLPATAPQQGMAQFSPFLQQPYPQQPGMAPPPYLQPPYSQQPYPQQPYPQQPYPLQSGMPAYLYRGASYGAPIAGYPPYGQQVPGAGRVPSSKLQLMLNRVVVDSADNLGMERLQTGLTRVGNKLLTFGIREALGPLLMMNVYGLANSIKKQRNEGVPFLAETELKALRPKGRKKNLQKVIQGVKDFAETLRSKCHSQANMNAGELLMLVLVAQHLDCVLKQNQNPNDPIMVALIPELFKEGIYLQNEDVQVQVFERLLNLGIKLDTSAGQQVTFVNQILTSNMSFFSSVTLENRQEICEKFIEKVTATIPHPQQKALEVNTLRQALCAPSCQFMGGCMMAIMNMQTQLAHRMPIYEFVKTVITHEGSNMKTLMMTVASMMGFETNTDELTKAGDLLASTSVPEMEAKRALMRLINEGLNGASQSAFLDTVMTEMNFNPDEVSEC